MSISWSAFGNAIINNAKAKRIPLVAQFELTSRCNLSCKMCYVCNKSNAQEVILKEKTAKEWISLARQARDAGVLYVLLTGGEVFIREDFKEIYEAISEMGFSVQIYTNGTLITPEIAQWLGKKPPAKISVTLYGASKETYKIITGNALAYERAINGIELLQKENILVAVRTTTVKGNKEDSRGIFDITNKKGVVFGMGQYISPRREGTFSDPLAERLTPEETIEYNKDIRTYISQINSQKAQSGIKNSSKQKPDIMKADIDSIVEQSDQIHENSAFSCSAGHCSFWVTWDGRMTPCGMMADPVVDIFNEEFNDAWEELKKACDSIPKAINCDHCESRAYCIKCPAKLKLETGTYTACAEYLKQLSQLTMSASKL